MLSLNVHWRLCCNSHLDKQKNADKHLHQYLTEGHLCYCGFFFFFTLHHNNKCRIYFCSADMYSSTFKNDLKQMKVPDDMKGSIVHVVNYTVIKHSLSIKSYSWHRRSGWPFLTSLNFQRFFSMCLCVTSYHISLTANNRKRSPSTALLMPLSF